MDDGLRADPIENTPEFKKVIKAVEKEAEENLKKQGIKRSIMSYYRHLGWEKQKILKEKHGIDWKTPDEMNPEVILD